MSCPFFKRSTWSQDETEHVSTEILFISQKVFLLKVFFQKVGGRLTFPAFAMPGYS